jgi:fatty-acyl-CoA synthase
MAAHSNENKGSPLKAWVRALERTAPIEKSPARTLPALLEELALRFEAAPALVAPDTTLTYRGLAQAFNRYARWGLSRGLRGGDVVCLLMENCPHYLAVWLGLSHIGVTVALVNTNLAGEALLHSVSTVAPRYVIVSAKLSSRLQAVRPRLAPSITCWMHGSAPSDLPRLDQEAAAMGADALEPGEFVAPQLTDRALCIYTSGTTGLPKAANVSHYRLMQWSHWFAGLMDVTSADRMFDCLPLYHSVGGVVATGALLVSGGAVVLRERFSAGSFWEDVAAERCTLFQYIGELCRYLLNSAPRPAEARHALRLACGNGLRGDVWVPFQERFRVPQILEYYAATEGNFSLYNCEGKPGAIGRVPPFLSHRMPIALVKFDVDTAAPTRDGKGRCIPCAVDEPGEAIGQVLAASGTTRFEGYTDEEASTRKLLRDVFAEGDFWYRTGDLMRKDAQGFYYFVDRVGETFRWKGENVSTTEVAGIIAAVPGVADVAVYGVAVPRNDGRAGMAALVVTEGFSVERLHSALVTQLPAYARPVFLRIVPTLDLTGTFKLRKNELVQQGYDPLQIQDSLFVNDSQRGAYVPLDHSRYERLLGGTLRV